MFGIVGIVVGVLMLLFGAFCVFFFPSSHIHQQQELAMGGVIIGIVSLLIGAALVFW